MCVHSKAKTTGRRFRCRMFIGVATVTLGVFVKFTRRLRLRRVRIPVQACALRDRTALVHDAVELAKDCTRGGADKLVNAVLRRLSNDRPWLREDFERRCPAWDRVSLPRWLWQRWARRYGQEALEMLGLGQRALRSGRRDLQRPVRLRRRHRKRAAGLVHLPEAPVRAGTRRQAVEGAVLREIRLGHRVVEGVHDRDGLA